MIISVVYNNCPHRYCGYSPAQQDKYMKKLAHFGSLIVVVMASSWVQAREISPDSLESFFSSAWQVQNQRFKLSGAVVTVVKDGKLVFNRGYGLADHAKRVPVDPDVHLFRIASISKPFTWVAVMQQVEAGNLDLDRDINEYLETFQIPGTFPEPITMRHLLNHNAGFEDNVLDLGRRSAEDLLPLGEYLADHIPDRVRPAGQFSSYSNHSTALAAHVIEIVSGQDWSTYIEQNILEPLEMRRTVARHPFPETLAADRALSYYYGRGSFTEMDFLHWLIYPAGMMSTTGADMSKFMISMLSDGEGVLSRETHEQMLEPTYRPFEGANAWMHGFQQQDQNGVFAYGHGGDLNGYHSGLMLLPDHDLGFFVSYNTVDGNRAQADLMSAFMDHFFPEDRAPVREPAADARQKQTEYHGVYAALRRDFTDFAKLALLVSSTTVSTNQAGYLTLSSPGGTNQYVATDADRFVLRDGYSQLNFVRDSSGAVTHMQFGNWPASTMDRLAWYAEPSLHRILFGAVVLICGIYLVYWPVKFARRRFYKVDTEVISPVYYGASWLVAGGIVYSIVNLFRGLSNQDQFYFGMPQSIQTLLAVNLIVTLVGVALTVLLAARCLKGGSLSERINFGLFGVTVIAFTGLGIHWNTLTWYL